LSSASYNAESSARDPAGSRGGKEVYSYGEKVRKLAINNLS